MNDSVCAPVGQDTGNDDLHDPLCIFKLTLKEVELEATREERDTARRDVRDTHLAKDEIIRRAWEVRDQAVARKNAAEIELARTRIDVLQINSQLLEAIQQKVELSQQLDQWQVKTTKFFSFLKKK